MSRRSFELVKLSRRVDGAEKRLRTAHEVDAASVKKVTRLT